MNDDSSWLERLRQLPAGTERMVALMDLGRKLEPFPEVFRDEAHLVPGCVSRVWLALSEEAGILRVWADAEAPMVKGLAALVVRLFDRKPIRDLIADRTDVVQVLRLDRQLTPTRLAGLRAMMDQVRTFAQARAAAISS